MVQFGIWVCHKVINPLRPVTHTAWLSLSQTRFWDLDKILISYPIQSTWRRLKPPTSIWAERQPEAGIMCFQTSVDFKHIWSFSAHSLHCLWMAHRVSKATYKYRVTLLKKKKSQCCSHKLQAIINYIQYLLMLGQSSYPVIGLVIVSH